MRRGRVVIAGVVVVAVAVALLFIWWTQRPQVQQPTGPSLYQMLVALRAEAEAPGLTVDAAAKSLKTPDAAFAFVRDQVRYSPYPGRQQEPETVLRSRVANSDDRAALLNALLDEMKVNAKLRVVRLTELPGTPPAAGLAAMPRDAALIQQIADRIGYKLDGEQSDLWADESLYADRMSTAAKTMAATDQRIRALVQFNDPHDAPAATPRLSDLDRAWVEVVGADGAVSQRYDPTYPGLPFPDTADDDADTVAPTSIVLSVERSNGVDEPILAWNGPVPLGDVELGFLPTVDMLTALAGPPDPGKIPMWTPTLTVDGTPTIGVPIDTAGRHYGGSADTPPPFKPDDVIKGSGGQLVSARLAAIDASHFPEVSLALDLKTNGVPTWTAEDFLVLDAGQRHSARIRSLGLDARPLVVVTDVSGSMDDGDKIVAAKKAMLALVDKLAPDTPFALVAFTGDAHVIVPLGPVGDGQAIRDAINQLQAEGGTAIAKGLAAGLDVAGGQPATLVLLTDGADDPSEGAEVIDPLVERLKAGHDRLATVALGNDADTTLLQGLVRQAGGTYQHIDEATGLAALYGSLADNLSGRLVLDYTAAPGAGPHDVALGIAGYDEALSGVYTAPAPPPAPLGAGDRLVLNVTTSGPGGSTETSRPIMELGKASTAWDMVSRYRLLFDLGAYPEPIGAAAYLTTWIDILRPQDEPAPAEQRIDYEAASTIGAYRAATTGLAGDDVSAGPNVYLLRQTINASGAMQTAFDVMQMRERFGTAKQDDGAYRLQLAGGLAEGFAIDGGDAVTRLAATRDLARVAGRADPPSVWSSAMLALRSSERYADLDTLYAASVPDTAWMIDGRYKSFEPFVDVDGSLAKGAYVISIAKEFAKIDSLFGLYTTVGGKALGAVNPAVGPAFNAILAFKREELKLWCFSTVMLGYVSEAIQGTDDLVSRDPAKAQANAAALCKIEGKPEDFVTRAVKSASKAAAKAWASSAKKQAIKYRGLDESWKSPETYTPTPPGKPLPGGFVPIDGGFHNAVADAAKLEAPTAFD